MIRRRHRRCSCTVLGTCLVLLAAGSASAAEPAQPSSASTENPRVDTSAQTAPASTALPANPAAAQPRAATPRRAANDRLDLDTTVVTGNRELPKVLYIVPWKKAELGDLPAQPFNTLLDEVLTPLDRDVFRREVTYYGAVSGDAANRAPNVPAPAAVLEK